MQRTFAAGALILLLWCSAAKCLAKDTDCPNSNPFITLMKQANATLFERPVSSNSICGFEFKKYGSCCQIEDLSRFAHKDTAQITESMQAINQEYKNFEGFIPKIFKLVRQISVAPLHPTNKTINTRIQGARTFLTSLNTAHVQNLMNKFQASNEFFDKFEQTNTDCWTMQAKARRVAACYTCSGRSKHFFKEDKALISASTCQEFVKSCSIPLSASVKFIQSFELLNWLIVNLYSAGIETNIDRKINRTAILEYFRAFKNEHIIELVDAVRKFSSPELQAQMCSKFLRLGEKPIISQMRTIFKSAEPWRIETRELAAHLAAHKEEISVKENQRNKEYNTVFVDGIIRGQAAPTTSNWGLSRLLQFSGLLAALGSDSTIMDVNDPSYSSVGVSGKAPMDLSQEFP